MPPIEWSAQGGFSVSLRFSWSPFASPSADSTTALSENIVFYELQRELAETVHSIGADSYVEQIILRDLQIQTDELRFKAALESPLTVKSSTGDETIVGPSLFQALLDLETIQPRVLRFLVGKLIERDALSSATAGVDSSVKQILQLFRGAEYIADTAELTMKLLEAMNLVKMETQRELIQLLPEVAADSEHKIVVAELTALLSANSDLVGSIMQALANLQITDQRTQTELLNAVAERLASADIEDIPAMLHFLFQTIPKSEMSVYLNQLRANLDVDSLAQLVNNAKCPQKGKQNTLVMDALRISLYINRTAIDSWIKLLDAAPPAAIKTLDIIALLIIHASDTSTRRKIYRIVKSKLPQVSEPLDRVIRLHQAFAEQFFNDIMMISLNCDAMKFTFPPLFEKLGSYYQQEVIGALAVAVGNGEESEAESAIELLQLLCDRHRAKIRPFNMMIKSLLDFSMDYSLNIIRKLYFLVSGLTLSFEGAWQNELMIMLKKQVSNPSKKWKSIGIVGAVQYIKAMDCTERTIEPSSSQSIGSENHQMVVRLLQTVFNNCKTSVEFFRLFIEELTGIIPESRPSLVAWIYENIASNFHSQYIQEITVGDNSLWMSANGDIELDIAISLFPNALRRFIVADQSGVGEPEEASDLPDFSKSCLHLMCPLFDLLHACECRANAGNLEGIYLIFYDSWVIFEKEIDALLSCGILMDDVELKDIVGLEGPRKELICFAIYFAIQWFRKLLNAFSAQENEEIRRRCLDRVDQLILLERYLINSCNNIDLVRMGLIAPTTPTSKHKATNPEADSAKENVAKNSVREDYDSDGNRHELDLDIKLENIIQEINSDEECDARAVSNLKSEIRQLKASFVDLNSAFILLTSNQLKADSELWLLQNFEDYLSRAFDTGYRSPLAVARRKKLGMLDHYPDKQQALNISGSILPALIEKLCGTFAKFESCVPNESVKLLHLIRCLRYIFASCATSGKEFRQSILKSIITGKPDAATLIEVQAFKRLYSFLGGEQTAEIACAYATLLSDFYNIFCADLPEEQQKLKTKTLNQYLNRIAAKVLATDWTDKKIIDAEALKKLLLMQIKNSASPVSEMLAYATEGIVALFDGESEILTAKYPLLTRVTLAVYFKVIFAELGPSLQHQLKTISTNDDESLTTIEQHCLIFRNLMDCLKSTDARTILSNSLKCGRQFVECFTRHALPVIERNLSSQQKDRVAAILKLLQTGTRTLQNACAHAKTLKDASLTATVPLVRKTLENFILIVKTMLSKHNYLSALWVGNLKHRDLQGQIVPSQQVAQPASVATINGRDGDEKAPKKRRATAAAATKEPGQRRKRKTEEVVEDIHVESFLSNSIVNTSDEEED